LEIQIVSHELLCRFGTRVTFFGWGVKDEASAEKAAGHK
jgi:hypothetical protein